MTTNFSRNMIFVLKFLPCGNETVKAHYDVIFLKLGLVLRIKACRERFDNFVLVGAIDLTTFFKYFLMGFNCFLYYYMTAFSNIQMLGYKCRRMKTDSG